MALTSRQIEKTVQIRFQIASVKDSTMKENSHAGMHNCLLRFLSMYHNLVEPARRVLCQSYVLTRFAWYWSSAVSCCEQRQLSYLFINKRLSYRSSPAEVQTGPDPMACSMGRTF